MTRVTDIHIILWNEFDGTTEHAREAETERDGPKSPLDSVECEQSAERNVGTELALS